MGIRPAPEYAKDVAALPYDVMNTEEAREMVKGNPYSFLHIDRAEIDLPVGTDPYSPAVYEKAKDTFMTCWTKASSHRICCPISTAID